MLNLFIMEQFRNILKKLNKMIFQAIVSENVSFNYKYRNTGGRPSSSVYASALSIIKRIRNALEYIGKLSFFRKKTSNCWDLVDFLAVVVP